MRAFTQKQSQSKLLTDSVAERPDVPVRGLRHSANATPAAYPGHDFGKVPVYPLATARLQTRLAISTPGDVYEQEADRIAERVTSTPDSVLQRACACGGECSNCKAGQAGEKERLVQTKRARTDGAQAAEAPPIVHEGLGSPGQPLDSNTLSYFEPRFGYDFSRVRVHTGAKASESALAVNALAYTVGPDIVFGSGQYQPGTDGGRRLLAHELTHFVQQSEGGAHDGSAATTIQRQNDPAEPAPAETAAPPAAPAPTPGPTLMLAKPPHFPQSALTCWASSIASWQRVKGFVASNVTEQTLINQYRGTGCVDKSDALAGSASDVEGVYAEWRLQLKVSAEVPDASWTFDFVKNLIENHGHFIIATGSASLMHSIVVYGVASRDKNDPNNFVLFVEDPMASDNEKHIMFLETPRRVVLGTEKSAGPAPCRSKAAPTEEEEKTEE